MTNDTSTDTPMDRGEFLGHVQRYVANVGISGSSLRNQGAKGVVETARCFLADLDLNPLREMEPTEYTEWLESVTRRLQATLPEGAKRWGAARKAVNVFMCHAFFNKDLSATYDLIRFGDVMETPLDSMAANELRRRAGDAELPRWPGVGYLDCVVSQKYQNLASRIAKRAGIPRACLDVLLWRPKT